MTFAQKESDSGVPPDRGAQRGDLTVGECAGSETLAQRAGLAVSSRSAARIDWNALHARLEAFEAALGRDFAPSDEEETALLRSRARALAREPRQPGLPSAETVEFIAFTMAHERYGIEPDFVREIRPLQDLTSIPCTPPFVMGVVYLRGRIVSLVDLKKFFGLPEKGLTDLNRVIVLDNGTVEFGILADMIEGVRQTALQAEEESLPTLTGVRREYLRGLGVDGTILLNAAAILSDRAILVDEQERA